MQLKFYCRREELGTVQTGKGGLVYGGNKEAVRGLVEYYADTTGLEGEELLKHVLLHVRGQTRAVKVGPKHAS
jgi:hypothetical protein